MAVKVLELHQLYLKDPSGNMIELHQVGTCRCVAAGREPVGGMS